MQQRKVELLAGLAHPAGTAEEATYGDIADEALASLAARKTYTAKTAREARYDFDRLLRDWRDVRIASTRTGDVDAYDRALAKAGLSTGRRRKLLDRLAQLMAHAVREGYISRLPCRVDRPKMVQRTVIEDLTDDEMRRLAVRAWEDHDKRAAAVVLLARHAGLRADELAHVRGEDLNLERGYVRVEVRGETTDRPKAPRSRTVPVEDADTLTALESLRPARGRTIFRVDGRDGIAAIVRQAWQDALGTAPQLHRLRHTYATREAARGVPLPLLQMRLGHRSVTTTMRYVHATDPALMGHPSSGEHGAPKKKALRK
jgi:integrase/recombinase XerD